MLTRKCVLVVVMVVIMCMGCFGITGLLHHDNLTPPPKETGEGTPYYLDVIPTKPDDFDFAINTSTINFCELKECYYIQPDFYAESWAMGRRHYEEHDYSRWVVYGHGAYPAHPKATFSSSKVGEELQIYTLYRTGWGVETWQGVKLMPAESEYFEVVCEPNEFLLPPTFPLFEEGWVKKLNITVGIKKIPPNGVYEVVMDEVNPSEEKSEEWKREVLGKNVSSSLIRGMIYECKEQNEKDNLGLDCDELIKLRRNKYIEGGNIDVGGRLIIIIVVDEGGNKKDE